MSSPRTTASWSTCPRTGITPRTAPAAPGNWTRPTWNVGTAMRIKAADVELGDMIEGQRVTGWFIDGKGRFMIEYAGRWNVHSHLERLEVERLERPLGTRLERPPWNTP